MSQEMLAEVSAEVEAEAQQRAAAHQQKTQVIAEIPLFCCVHNTTDEPDMCCSGVQETCSAWYLPSWYNSM